ncbi:NTF2 and RRM domain-containing protein [Boeremia exigua]|uniref:NTF2 and RRM domain-containing protein n=1 Tax=Boeremia exigua TaxID=749465 RepID=UPI001E8DB877|nr:NTF2 and RRM domain-containing protein [Boeremia exigua]KAH6620462.1 NTF2 and RRM domain-containing protein [Boeremia exigua]
MAATESSAPTNGDYVQNSEGQPAQQAAASEIPKDEVGWYFVEQYYTTLSKSPDRLFLFYNKRSQFVSGVEEEKVNVCVGQKPIIERIKELDFKDTKVRVTNVDSQGSDANIVIQVVGEISNKGQPHKRFVQTFVLAEQTNGYFVLNDIFRYLAEEPEEEEEAQEPAANGVEEPASTATASVEPEAPQGEVASSEEDLTKVDEKLEEVAQEEAPAEETTATGPTEVAAEAEKAPEVEEVAAAAPEEAPKEAEAPAEQIVEEEKPKEPAPTPAPAAKSAAPVAMPAGPPKLAAPRTWASLAASAHKVATPVLTAPAAQQAPKEAKAAAPAQSASGASAQTPAAAREQSPTTSQGETAGWQSVTGHKKEQSRAQNQAPAAEADQKRAYIKNVYSQVQEGSLRAALTKFGEIEFLDLSRGKNAAFVDFKTPAGYQAAVAANPHTVDGVELKVEERRTRPQQYSGSFPRGGGSQRGRGGPGGPRGGFVPRGRGGAARGRGAPQES